MADVVKFNEGMSKVGEAGLPATCTFDLSTKTAEELGAEATYAGGYAVATGTGYSAKTQSRPTPSKGKFEFTALEWKTEAHTDWPSGVKSIVLRNGTTNLIAVWNLQAGGTARNLAAANTTEKFTPTLTFA